MRRRIVRFVRRGVLALEAFVVKERHFRSAVFVDLLRERLHKRFDALAGSCRNRKDGFAFLGERFAPMRNQRLAFFFGYTLNAILGAALYGVFFYKMRVSVLRAAVCKLVINVCVNGLLGTLWYAMLYGKGFNAVFWPRMITNIGKVPVETVVLLLLLPALIAAARRAKLRI